ncbi:hypothetical protein FKW77_009046 [Venturia effusa]|uniref:Condensation domain-containing protein n=1 Tax=Venturia effusa TaxID=50376 RepID=A0A517LBI8_9PEZI|nr:hypothetical protein FKW77_009046 [Venturia effusa]
MTIQFTPRKIGFCRIAGFYFYYVDGTAPGCHHQVHGCGGLREIYTFSWCHGTPLSPLRVLYILRFPSVTEVCICQTTAMTTSTRTPPPTWVLRYANNYHAWKRSKDADGNSIFSRPLGLVEAGFHHDGIHHGGRADLHCTLTLEVKSDLTRHQLRNRILLVWTLLRMRHPLLHASVPDDPAEVTSFVLRVPRASTEALDLVAKQLVSLQHYAEVDVRHFVNHVINTGRVVDSSESVSKLFILPLQPLSNGRSTMQLVFVVAHMVADGLSVFNWVQDFIDLMNREVYQVQAEMDNALDPHEIEEKLIPAQEDLYPTVPGNLARQRWFWAITRILRHVQKPLSSGFVNPLRRKHRESIIFDSHYADTLDYDPSQKPPLNTGHSIPVLTPSASQSLQNLCREAKTSIGAGIFALVALVMSEIEEKTNPNISETERKPFVASFPLNPRPFFGYTGPNDSCMLAFSQGIVMPFLPSSLPVEGRFKLLAKAAHRQLRVYQKRLRDPVQGVDNHSPLRMMASNYLLAIERVKAKLPPHLREGIDPQGAYPWNSSFQTATCGVSSVGSVKHWVGPGRYNLGGGTDFGVDYRNMRSGVRARDNEFLCGASSEADGLLRFSVSYDASAMDEELVKLWEERIATILEPSEVARL